MKPVIGLTIGDPAGVGPEIVLKAMPYFRSTCEFVVFGDRTFLEYVNAHVLGRTSLPRAFYVDFKNVDKKNFRFGVATANGGKASGTYIEVAVRAALNNEINALVTAPINKEGLQMGGWHKQHVGHTEILAHLTGSKSVALMLVTKNLRAVHVTSHIPLKKVSASLTKERVFQTISLTHEGLTGLGIARPRIAVCGLNPHAGENGLLGDEEAKIISPAVQQAKRRGIRVDGPISADVVWPKVRDRVYDAGVAMYHDQGQIAVKLLSFENQKRNATVGGVNMTLGLPIVRTSVAHGTAYEIAGKDIASEQSLVEAIRMALSLVKRRKI